MGKSYHSETANFAISHGRGKAKIAKRSHEVAVWPWKRAYALGEFRYDSEFGDDSGPVRSSHNMLAHSHTH